MKILYEKKNKSLWKIEGLYFLLIFLLAAAMLRKSSSKIFKFKYVINFHSIFVVKIIKMQCLVFIVKRRADVQAIF